MAKLAETPILAAFGLADKPTKTGVINDFGQRGRLQLRIP